MPDFIQDKLNKHRKVLANLFFQTNTIFFGQVHYGNLLVLGQIENKTLTFSVPSKIEIF